MPTSIRPARSPARSRVSRPWTTISSSSNNTQAFAQGPVYLAGAQCPARFGIPVPGLFLRAVVHVLHDLVALASRFFEACPVEDGDVAAAVTDQLALLQRMGGVGDGDPLHSQHVAEEFVRHAELIRLDAVMGHQ